LVLHGDIVDTRFVRSHLITRLGSRIDHGLRLLDRALSRQRRGAALEARSTIEGLLAGINVMLYRGRRHERRLVEIASQMGLDGVICGHFHIANLNQDHGLIYANCGDWLDSMTALAETQDGSLQMLSMRPAAEGLTLDATNVDEEYIA
jgi:UDP-2,3-diacylglucosamine pyrophosphatase LpxH